MLVTSALVVRNVYAAYFVKDADERTYVRVGRISSFIVPVGAACVSLISMDVLGQFKLALEVPILFAAPFWVGLYWRGVGKTAAWLTIAFSALFFFLIPYSAPKMVPGLTRNAAYTIANDIVVTTITRPAQQTDVAKREADRSVWQTRHDEATKLPEPDRSAALKKLGALPGEIAVGDKFQDIYRSGGKAIFWKDGLTPVEGSQIKEVTIRSNGQGNRRVDIIRQEGEFTGQGLFKLDFILYQFLGIDLTTKTDAMLETLRLPPRLITPFVVLILLGWITPGTPRRKLDRYFAKMKTPVQSDPEIDREHLEAAFANLEQLEAKKLFPGTRLEFQRPTLTDVLGFVICFLICFLIIGLAVVLSSIGAG